MNKHGLWMIIGCALPLLLILLMPLFGISSKFSVPVFIMLMFGCHLLMMGRHGKHQHKNPNEFSDKKQNEQHATHQH